MDQKDQDTGYHLTDQVVSTFSDLWQKTHSNLGFPPLINYDDAMKIAREQPLITRRYLDLMENTKDFDSCLRLISYAPKYALKLRDVFEQCNELLPIYSSLSTSLPSDESKMLEDKRVGFSRISTICNAEAVTKHLEKIQQLEVKLNTILGSDEKKVVARPFDGLAEVILDRIPFSRDTRTGIYLLILPKNTDFFSISRTIKTSGIISSQSRHGEFGEVGYLLRNSYEMDEVPFFDTLCKYGEVSSEELNKLLEESGKTPEREGHFAKHVFGEGQ